MSLRATAIVAGVIGLLLLAAGLIADSQRPPRDVVATASLDTAIAVFEPEMIAFAADSRVAVVGDGDIVAVSARPADAQAWLADHDATRVSGLPDWETLSTDAMAAAEPSPTASPSPSPTASPESSPSPSPSASPGAANESEDQAVDLLAASSQDHWRTEWRGQGRLAIQASAVPPGETLVFVSADGSPLESADMALTRDVDDGWITPLIWWGAFLLAVGVIVLLLRFIDLRPAQARSEEWIAKRQRAGEDDGPEPSSRRARRAKGQHLPETNLDDDSLAASAAAPLATGTPASVGTPASAGAPVTANTPFSAGTPASAVTPPSAQSVPPAEPPAPATGDDGPPAPAPNDDSGEEPR